MVRIDDLVTDVEHPFLLALRADPGLGELERDCVGSM
jgi:hypothetical protein